MIGKNFLKGLAVTGAAVAVAAATPLMSSASTHYTGKTPASIAMMATTTGVSATPMSTKHKHSSHHKSVTKATVSSKHHLHKKHLSVSSKKKHTI
jgi:hypothetical protein